MLVSAKEGRMSASKMPASLMHQWTLSLGVQREGRYLNIKLLVVIAFHLVTSAHHPRRRVERGTTRVCKTLAGLEEWLLPNHTGSLDLGEFAACIGDHPVPASQLNGFPSLILDGHSIGPEILRISRRRIRLQVSRLNANRYSSCDCPIRRPICHKGSLEQTLRRNKQASNGHQRMLQIGCSGVSLD